MNDSTLNRDRSVADGHTGRADSGLQKKAYTPPTLQRHAKLPVITAGSISKEMWQFDNGEPD